MNWGWDWDWDWKRDDVGAGCGRISRRVWFGFDGWMKLMFMLHVGWWWDDGPSGECDVVIRRVGQDGSDGGGMG